MPESLRMWRWLSALALVAVGLVMGASVAGSAGRAATMAGIGTRVGFLSGAVPHQPRPFRDTARASRRRESYAAQSTNWSGQIATGTTYTRRAGNWVVPTVQPTQYSGASATWIGIDGGPASPGSIIQTGTEQCSQGGATSYAAWYELYPAPPVVGRRRLPRRPDERVHHDRTGGSNWTLTHRRHQHGRDRFASRARPIPAPTTRPSGSRSLPTRWALRSPRSPTSGRQRSATWRRPRPLVPPSSPRST